LLELDLRTVIVLNAAVMLLMSLGLLVAVRNHLGRMPGVGRWSVAAVLLSGIWLLTFLRGTVPDRLLAGVGTSVVGLVAALYFHALVDFTQSHKPVRWAYGLAALNAALVAWFGLVTPHIGWRIVWVSALVGTLFLASSALLLLDGRRRTAGTLLTGSVFGVCGAVLWVRAVYYLFWNLLPDQNILVTNPVQAAAFLTFFFGGILLSIGFVLMCNERQGAETNRLALMAEHTSAAVLLGDAQRNIEWVNPAFIQLTGYSLDEVVGRQPGDFLRGPGTDPAGVERIRSAVSMNRSIDEEQLFYRKDGTPFWVSNKIDVVLDRHGEPVRYLSVLTDITARKQAEGEIVRLNAELEQRVLSRTAQLENANKELEAFSYSVAHDLRTPLSSIDGFSHLLERQVTDERSRHYLVRIRASVKHMGDLTQALLSLSRITRSSLRWENLDISALAAEVAGSLREREPDRACAIGIQPDMRAVGDPHLLLQVMDNLIGNAWKFSARHDGARIDVGCQDGPDKAAVYFVRDNGVGFDMAHAKRLFGPFERLHTPGDYAGTGIGLATVHRIIQRHGGRTWAESAPGEGATFFFTLGMPPG
jgi:PAS domain S-box-containing protein